MAITQNTFTGNGSNLGPFSFTFKWLEPTDIKVTVAGVLKTAGTHYNLQNLNYTTKTGGEVLFTAGNAPANNAAIVIYRQTDDTDLAATFYSGSAIRAQDLNSNFTQGLYVAQEANNTVASALSQIQSVPIANIDIDGGTDIGGALSDADLFIVDDGATGTNRKAAATRITDYAFGKVSGDITVTSGGVATIANNTVTTAKLNDGAVTSAKIADGTILNTDIASGAAIADTKLATISTANKVSLAAVDIDGATSTTTLTSNSVFPVDVNGSGSNRKILADDLAGYVYSGISGDVSINPNTGVASVNLGFITNSDISATAEIAVSKLADGAARQLLQTDAAGTDVEWTSNVDIPGTLDVTGVATFDNDVNVGGNLTVTNTGALVFEGGTNDIYETTLAVVDPTADRIITLPNVTGTVITTGDSGTVTSTMIADGTIVNADINASAAIDKTKISGTAITAADTGTVTSTMIADGTIVNADINASAAIAHSKLANITAGSVLLGNASNVPTATAISGDLTLDSSGVATLANSGVSADTYQSVTVNAKGLVTSGSKRPVDYQEFTSSGTWTKPTGATFVYIECVGGGGGGGSGRRGATSTTRTGGGGGAGGAWITRWLPASAVGSTETVTVAAGGSGGTAITTDTTNGNPGSNGGSSSFGSHVITPSTGGGGGGASTGTGANGVFVYFGKGGTSIPTAGIYGADGGDGTTTTTSPGNIASHGPAGGGGGTGVSSANATSTSGSAGGQGFAMLKNSGTTSASTGSGGAGGVNAGDSGSAGPTFGDGGGGGRAQISGTGGSGGNGAFPGGGGGGGAGSLNGFNSGAGGNGGAGVVRVWTW